MLPRCDCANCRRWVAMPRPAPMSMIEAIAWGRAYADRRRRYRAEHPFVTKDEVAEAEGALL